MKTKFQIHIILVKEETDDEGGVERDVLEEDEPAGYREEFDDEDKARTIYSVLTGVDVNRLVPALDEEIRNAVLAYKEGVLEEGPKKYRVWISSDAPMVLMALAMKGKDASLVQINAVANQMGLT